MSKKDGFKPLWRIHNRTYRQYAKGIFRKRIARYWTKIGSRLRFLSGKK